jgi:predicted PurR-regulated permease PerM
MARHHTRNTERRALIVLAGIIVAVVVFAALCWAQKVLIPLALAIYVAFLLSPVVGFFQRRGLPRIPAVLATTILAAGVVAGLGYVLVSQISDFIVELPKYQGVIKSKINSMQEGMGDNGALANLHNFFNEIGNALQPGPEPKGPPGSASGPPLHVVVDQVQPAWVDWLPASLPTAFELLAQFALVIVLALFMLLAREDLRNRFIALVGYGHMTVTTKAADDASQRLGRFLLRQFLVNGSFGLLVGVGTALLGLNYPLLWGVLGALMRYIPYVGSPLAALFPLLQCIVQFPGWWQALAIIIGIIVIELVYANILEPWVYGVTTGVSPVALLVTTAFWTFIWGPVGLVLSTPLTVCLVVLGKYVPSLWFLSVLLGNDQVLDEGSTFYQRLSARDKEEAYRIVSAEVESSSPEAIYESLLLPTLISAARDHRRGGLNDDDLQFMLQAVQEAAARVESKRPASERVGASSEPETVHILAISSRDEIDEAALQLLAHLLQTTSCKLEVVGSDVLSSELLEMIKEKQPTAVCIAALPPGGLARARWLVKRLRHRFARLPIVVGRWGALEAVDNQRRLLRDAGANQVRIHLLETRNDLLAWRPAIARTVATTATT